ncbi:MAG: ComEA family DNA-binding protein [Firmicutes bacterium]|nr:ComEA family DNA-binding protein [Bacillota bacterium]
MIKKEFWKEKNVIKITASLFLLAVFLLLSLMGKGSNISYETEETHRGSAIPTEESMVEIENDKIDDPAFSKIIFVDVIGCVVNPGVYQLEEGSRVFQALELAGGLTEEAEVKSINRAAVLSDEQVITVLSVEEYEEMQKNSGGLGFVDGKVELNSADAKALESLSGIGPSMAEKILQYRQEHGRFHKIEDLMKVPGIGEKTFQQIKDKICVQ